MAIVNGYVTLEEMRARLQGAPTYTAATLSFDAATKKIKDSAKGLKRFEKGMYLKVSGSTSNNGYYTVATGAVPGEIVVTETLVNENAGASVTLTDVTDQASDAQIEDAINGVSRSIERACHRRFWKNGTSEVRYYTPDDCDELAPEDDIVSLAELATDDLENRTYSRVWTTADYELEPANASLDGWPYTRVVTTPHGARDFEAGSQRSARLTGVFGWPAVPSDVKLACSIMVMRLYRRKETPFGVLGAVDQGSHQTLPIDQDVIDLLTPYVKEAPRAVVHWDLLDR